MQTNATDLVPLDLTETGSAVKERIPTCEQAVSIALNLIQWDVTRANRRQKVQGFFDGNSPRTAAQMAQGQRGDDSNINWKEFKGTVMNAWNPFFDLVCEIPVCIDGELEAFGSAIDQELCRGFFQFFHEMLFEWTGFDNMNQLRDLQMLLHGTGPLAWEDEYMPFPRPILASDFYVNQRALATLENADYVMITSIMDVGNLWRNIEDEKSAKAMGWNPEAVKDAIMNASSSTDLQTMGKQWDRWEQMFKNGDLYVSDNCKEVKIATQFVREMDGRITQLVFTYQESQQTDYNFLYKSVGKYASWDECVCVFFYDIGSDGTYYSIKGLGTEIFPFCALYNKINNNIADLVVTGIKPMFQPTTGSKIEDFQMVKMGGFNMIPQGLTKLDLDIGRSLQPAIEVSREFRQMSAQSTGSYTQSDLAPPTVEETAKSAMIRASERAKLTKGAHNRFYRSLDGQYREIWRRVTRKDLKPHHMAKNPKIRDLVMEFRTKCEELCANMDVPSEAVRKVKKIKATRSIGLGSPAMRIEIASAIMEKWGYLPTEEAKNNALRAYFSTITSYANVDAFAPSQNKPNTSTDAWDATMENDALNQDGEALITPRQNPVIHLQVHIASLERDAEMVQNGMMDPREAVTRLHAKSVHSWQHMAQLEGNPVRKQEYTQFAERLKNIAGLQDQLEQNIQEQDQANAESQPPEQDPDMVAVQGKLQLATQKQNVTLSLKEQKQRFEQQQKVRQQQFDQSLAAQKAISETAISAGKTAAQIHIDRTKAKASNGATP